MTAPEAKERALSRIIWGCVILVLILFGLYSMPRTPYPTRKPKESTLRAGLHQIRNAIDQFKADTGAYPATLIDLTAKTGTQVKAKIKPGSYNGPYLPVAGGIGDTGIRINPYAVKNDLRGNAVIPTDPALHWHYDPITGTIHPAVPTQGETLDGIPYTEL